MSSFDVHSLPPETRDWLEARVKEGSYADADAFLRDLLEEVRRMEAEDEAEIRKMVAEGLADIEQGDVIPGDQAFAQLRAEHYRKFGQRSEA